MPATTRRDWWRQAKKRADAFLEIAIANADKPQAAYQEALLQFDDEMLAKNHPVEHCAMMLAIAELISISANNCRRRLNYEHAGKEIEVLEQEYEEKWGHIHGSPVEQSNRFPAGVM